MRSGKSCKTIAFYTPEYRGETDFFGCASTAIIGRNAKSPCEARCFPITPEAIEISGTYEECIRDTRQAAREERIRGCIALLGNAGGENAFCRSIDSILHCPMTGGGAAIDETSATAGLVSRGGQANLLLITDDRFTIEVQCKNIHTALSDHEMKLLDSRTLLKIDGEEADGWLDRKKTELGFAGSDWEHLTFSDSIGINAHLSRRDGQILSGRDLERNMTLRRVRQEEVLEAMQSFYSDQNSIVFGCAGLQGLLEQDISTDALGLFLYGEVCCENGRADFGNLMLSKIRFAMKD